MAKGLKTLAALGGLGAAAYLAGKMGKKDNSMEDELQGQDTTTRRGDNSMEDELAGMSRKKSARSGAATKKKDNSMNDELAGMDRSKRARPAEQTFLSGEENANEARRLVNKSVSRGGPGLDRLGESAAGRFIQRTLRPASRSDMEGESGVGTEMVGAKRGGKIKAKKYAGGGSVGSASRRADGCAMRGKTKGRMV